MRTALLSPSLLAVLACGFMATPALAAGDEEKDPRAATPAPVRVPGAAAAAAPAPIPAPAPAPAGRLSREVIKTAQLAKLQTTLAAARLAVATVEFQVQSAAGQAPPPIAPDLEETLKHRVKTQDILEQPIRVLQAVERACCLDQSYSAALAQFNRDKEGELIDKLLKAFALEGQALSAHLQGAPEAAEARRQYFDRHQPDREKFMTGLRTTIAISEKLTGETV